jgi:hypothetical protein
MPIADILEIRLLPPFAIARVGSSPKPMDNYEVQPDTEPTGYRTLVPAETLYVKDKQIVKAKTPKKVRFRDKADKIRPVCPFFEVWARFEEEGQLEPLTVNHLDDLRLTPQDVTWRVHVANWKAYRRTADENDKIEAIAEDFNDHTKQKLNGLCNNFKRRKSIPFGSVQYLQPNDKFPEIRLRFTPGPGKVYGPRKRDKNVVDDVYNAKKGTWARYVEKDSNDPYKTTPGQIYAGEDETAAYLSRGYLDDACDGIVEVSLTVNGKKLSSFARIATSAPYFAPDSYHVRRLADDIEQLVLGPEVDSRNEQELKNAVVDIMRRARDTVRLMSTEVMNGNQGVGGFLTNNRLNMAMITAYGDDDGTMDGNYGREFAPIFKEDKVDSGWIRTRHESVLGGLLRSANADMVKRLLDKLRSYDQVGDLTDKGRRKMPAMMKGSDSLLLALTRRQFKTVKAWQDALTRLPAPQPECENPTWENCIKKYFSDDEYARNSMCYVTESKLDFYKYKDVKDWAAQIYKYVQIQAMPPARADIPTRPWSDTQVITFKQWMDNDCPEK